MNAVPASAVQPAAERVYDELRRRIATAQLPPGAVLVERDQAMRYALSRTPVRDALNQLAAEGLVERTSKRGTTVSLIDLDDIRGHIAVCEAIEVQVARQLTTTTRLRDLDVTALLRRLRRAAEEGDYREFLAADEAFHLALPEAAANARATQVAAAAWLHVNRVRHLIPIRIAAMRRSIRRCATVCDAIAGGDTVRAEQAVRAQFDDPSSDLLGEYAGQLPQFFVSGDGPGSGLIGTPQRMTVARIMTVAARDGDGRE